MSELVEGHSMDILEYVSWELDKEAEVEEEALMETEMVVYYFSILLR